MFLYKYCFIVLDAKTREKGSLAKVIPKKTREKGVFLRTKWSTWIHMFKAYFYITIHEFRGVF